MPKRTEFEDARDLLLQHAYQLGKDAAAGQGTERLANEFQRLHHQDNELVQEFMRGVHEQSVAHRSYQGVLLEHGLAKFNHDPRAKMSYYVTLETPRGEKTIWGVDLERAMRASPTEIGDIVQLDFKGSKVVTVLADILDSHGDVIGTEPLTTSRNVWSVTKTDGAVLGVRQPVNYAEDSKVATNAGARRAVSPSSMLGSSGLSGLKNLLSFGGSSVNAKLTDYSQHRAETDLSDALRTAGSHIAALKESGLSPLSDASLSDSGKADLLKAFLADSTHTDQVSEFARHLDKLSDLSAVVMAKGVGKGLDDRAVLRKAVDPIKDFMNEHEPFLKALHVDNASLFERLEDAVQHLLKMLSDLLERVGRMFKSGAASRSEPQAGN